MDADQYLWDKTGSPDPELQRWEALLGHFAAPGPPALVLPFRPRMKFHYWLAAACLLFGVLLVWQSTRYWRVQALSGHPASNGDVLETDQFSRARLRLGLTASVDVAPNTRLRIFGRRRLALEHGQISARLWAPPRSLSVDTSSSTAIDLGCAFVLRVNEHGDGLVRVTSGWVQFQFADRQAIVPAGAVALTRQNLGPGSPFFEDANPAFREALESLDFGATDEQALAKLLSNARSRDVVSLISLLRRLDPANRGRIFDRASQLLPAPAGLTREQVIAGTNQPGMDVWWQKLGFGDAKNWVVNWRDAFAALH